MPHNAKNHKIQSTHNIGYKKGMSVRAAVTRMGPGEQSPRYSSNSITINRLKSAGKESPGLVWDILHHKIRKHSRNHENVSKEQRSQLEGLLLDKCRIL